MTPPCSRWSLNLAFEITSLNEFLSHFGNHLHNAVKSDESNVAEDPKLHRDTNGCELAKRHVFYGGTRCDKLRYRQDPTSEFLEFSNRVTKNLEFNILRNSHEIWIDVFVS